MTNDPVYTVGEQRLWDETAAHSVAKFAERVTAYRMGLLPAEVAELIAHDAATIADALILERRKRVQK